ncbi:MAG: hypothetical protein J6U96_02765 [Elusimicrobiaceae bacterium]|nr:hypothetical protein [Elusimicrobiaceae bacterium]
MFDEVLPKLNQVVKNEIARGTNGFVARSVGKALLKRIGLMGIGVLAIVGVSAATASTASAQDKALARRLAENPMLFINANTQELAEIEKSELASQTAREIEEIIHIAATELNGEDRATVAQQQRQENLQKREAKKAITSSLHKVKAY